MTKILLVDENQDDRKLIKLGIGKIEKNFDLIEASNVKEALDILDSEEINLILSDYLMPDMDGLWFLRSLREDNNDIPFIFLTGQGNEELAADALRYGADDYFSKDVSLFHYQRLVNSINRVIKAHRLWKKSSEKSVRYKMLRSFMMSLVAITAGIISSISFTITIWNSQNMLGIFMVLLLASVVFISLSLSLTLIILIRQRVPSKLLKLKKNIITTYLETLDSSSLNPRKEGSR